MSWIFVFSKKGMSHFLFAAILMVTVVGSPIVIKAEGYYDHSVSKLYQKFTRKADPTENLGPSPAKKYARLNQIWPEQHDAQYKAKVQKHATQVLEHQNKVRTYFNRNSLQINAAVAESNALSAEAYRQQILKKLIEDRRRKR